jgi:signal transduction histidine kinase/DNA-binding NarL/FixJ family response regulator
LIEAETARIEQRYTDAMDHYERAIEAARDGGMVLVEAIAHELAGRFYLTQHGRTAGNAHLSNARDRYLQWGAKRKAHMLETEFPALAEASAAKSGAISLLGGLGDSIELMTVVKASLAVSGEIVLSKLIESLLTFVLEYAGAQRGLLILSEGEDHRIAAEAAASGSGVAVALRQSAPDPNELPLSVLHYTARTRERVLINDVALLNPFSADAYVRRARPKSVLCLPIVKQAKLVAILYLENSLAAGAFTPDRVAVLDLLASQAAISLENATLYNEMENRVERRTREIALKNDELEKASVRADNANQAKSVFLANMSHEIRTPINAITGFTTLALRTELDSKQVDYLRKIETAATGLLRVINDLLDYSKIEAGHLDMEEIPFRLSGVVESLIGYVDMLAAHKGLKLLVNIEPGVPEYLIGDGLRLGQVLLNLSSNAIKFTEHGEVELRVAVEERMGERLRLRFAVRDTGIGLTPQQAAKLFQPFVQADTSTTRRFGGTGLGLVICQRLVEMMRGRIWLESQPGVGTTFSFFAEVGVGSVETAETAPPRPQRRKTPHRNELRGVRLLLIEDNPINQQLARELLQQEGAEVDVADHGLHGLELLQGHATGYFDAALIDLQMPGIDGYETVRRIRHILQGETLPVIAMTAHAMREERERTLAAGMQDHIAKPIDVDLLIGSLRHWIGIDGLNEAALRHDQSGATAEADDTIEADIEGESPLPDSLPGIDLVDGLRRCGGDSHLYAELLDDFREIYTAAAIAIEGLCTNGKIADAYQMAHTVKGAAANLGMHELAAAAGALEQIFEPEGR